jgi:hypothetical protein
MADTKCRRPRNAEFSEEQNNVSGDPYAEASNRVLEFVRRSHAALRSI